MYIAHIVFEFGKVSIRVSMEFIFWSVKFRSRLTIMEKNTQIRIKVLACLISVAPLWPIKIKWITHLNLSFDIIHKLHIEIIEEVLVKFMFSKKATKIDKIFTIDLMIKVYVFSEGHKIWQNLHHQFDIMQWVSNRWWRFLENMNFNIPCPTQF